MGWREILPFVAAQVGAQPNVSHAYHNPIVAGTLLTPRAFSPGASICFGGPDTCHDPNAIRTGVATAPPAQRNSCEVPANGLRIPRRIQRSKNRVLSRPEPPRLLSP